MDVNAVKSLHIIFVVTWFAGLFYIFRLYVYHAEAASKVEPERSILLKQFGIMERKLWYIITWPSAVLATFFGLWLIVVNTAFLLQPWMHIKLFFVALLWLYMFYGEKVYRRIQSEPAAYTSVRLRLLNEVPTLILIAVVFLVVMKTSFHWVYGALGILGLAGIITGVVYYLRKKREKNGL
jgi:protoporphyrinogen IX oxidase